MKLHFQIVLLLLYLLSTNITAQVVHNNYSPASVLSAGKWFKMGITKDGVYKISFEALKQLGLEYPSNPKVYGNNAGQLSYFNDGTAPDDLKEIAISAEKGTDGIFNNGDYILFYGKGSSRWIFDVSTGEFEYKNHNYSDTAYYFLTSGPQSGKAVMPAPLTSLPANYNSSVSDALYSHEIDAENLIGSGREWLQPLPAARDFEIDPGFRNIISSEQVKYSLRVLARSSVATSFSISADGNIAADIPVSPVILSSTTGTYAQVAIKSGLITPKSPSPVITMKFQNSGDISAKAWIDYLRIQARTLNTFEGAEKVFTDSKSVAPGNVTEFTIKTPVDGVSVWDVTDPSNPRSVVYVRSADNIKFKSLTDSLRTFVTFLPGNSGTPVIYKNALPVQDLHASPDADIVIVSHPLFREYALKLADIHHKNSGLVSLVVTPAEIYNEFSGGIPDIAAIRNFLRMKYFKKQGGSHSLKYLILFGDGSYDNKSLPPGNPNFIPTWQSQNSNVFTSSFTSDDFYGLLEDREGEDSGTEDIGIGRLPVSDTVQAAIILDKIKQYLDPANTGQWKNNICLVADDEDGNTHMSDAEGLADLLADSTSWVNVDKIYFDAYRQISSATGQFYPDVSNAINDRINSGTLIFNYIGHGNETALGHERVLTDVNIISWINKAKLPLFITATCEFSRFDDIDRNIVTGKITGKNSAGEKILFKKDGGGIALMSTTRLVYSAPNYQLNRLIFDAAFDRDANGAAPRLGDIIRLAKNRSGEGNNKRNFLLLGDPVLRLAWPWYGKVITDSINGIPADQVTDTLKALSSVTVTGHIEGLNGAIINNFGGNIEPVVYDKPSIMETLGNDGGQKMQFSIQENILFNGRAVVDNGRFAFSFIVPREIDYTFGKGKISYYASDLKSDMTGSFADIVAGGFSNSASYDTLGPLIKLFLNDTLFRSGGITDPDPKLLAIIEDISGINISGAGVGHDLTCWLDNDRSNAVILNNLFENDLGSNVRGSVTFNFSDLTPGIHSLTMKAWDNFNNSAIKSVQFLVRSGEKFILENLMNFPNPFSDRTKISVEHNRPDREMDITLSIYSLNGDIIRIIKTTLIPGGYRIPSIEWDGTDSRGKKAGKGMYPYRLKISTNEGETTTISGSMIIL